MSDVKHNKIIFYYSGSVPPNPDSIIFKDRECVHFMDENEETDTKHEGVQKVDFSNPESIADSLHLSLPAEIIVIFLGKDNNENSDEETGSYNTLNTFFSILKGIYRPFMRQRRGKIIVLNPFNRQTGTIEDGVMHEGIVALSKVAAMELAGRNVSINSINYRSESDIENVSKFIQYMSSCDKTYITCQNISTIGDYQ